MSDELLIEDVRDAADFLDNCFLLGVVVDEVGCDCYRQLATELFLLEACTSTECQQINFCQLRQLQMPHRHYVISVL